MSDDYIVHPSDKLKVFKRASVYEALTRLSPKELAQFLYQIQIGLRRASSEKDWLKWLNSDLGDYDP